jgi:hypothetical protein
MTHKEFKLTVAKEIKEIGTGLNPDPIYKKVGETITVSEEAFGKILQGNAVGWYTEMGYANLLKQNFENEVEVTTVTIEHSVRKLGIRK